MNASLMEKITSVQEFATLPQVAIKVLNMMENDNSLNIKELSNLIETDASLTIKLIKVANSSLFATSSTVNSIQQAILNLGLNRVSNIAIGVAVFSNFMNSSVAMKPVLEKYWQHTSAVGVVSKSLAKRAGFAFKEVEFIGGLLHDVGKLAMMQFDNLEMYKKVIDLVENDRKNEYEAEAEVFGMNHCDIGSVIATRWKLPVPIASVIAHHNDFSKVDKDTRTMVAIVNMSNLLCDIWGSGFYEGVTSIQFDELPEWQHIVAESKHKDLDIEEITFSLEKDYREAEEFISLVKSDQ
jgi:putative nucleotidyltransferase with HDIG domain